MRRVLTLVLAGACLALPPTGVGEPAPESHQGQLRILLNNQPIGTERYQIVSSGTEIRARGETELRVGEQKLRQTAALELSPGLAPRRYEWKMLEPKATWARMEFEGSVGTIHFPGPKGKDAVQVFDFGAAPVALLDNNVFHHFLLLAPLYDVAAGGRQTIKVFIPQALQPGDATVELLGVETLTVDARPQAVRQLSISTEDNQVLLWITESGRFVRLRVPRANVEVVAEGASPEPPK